MNDPWISVKDDLPKDGELVCVKFWDCHSPHGYGSCLAKIRFGISQEQRDSMKRGELPDPLHPDPERVDADDQDCCGCPLYEYCHREEVK